MEWYCCDRCQRWQNCETKWFRGEKGIPQYCCPNCENYGECYERYKNEEAARAREAAKNVITSKNHRNNGNGKKKK